MSTDEAETSIPHASADVWQLHCPCDECAALRQTLRDTHAMLRGFRNGVAIVAIGIAMMLAAIYLKVVGQ